MALSDRELGLSKPIARRDFLNGAALAIGSALCSSRAVAGPAEAYPPALTGLRGQHPGSFETMHAIRDGSFFKTAGAIQETREHYDLVVVGAGISGLAAAYLYRQQWGPKARILILDNHDDFGGHAKRNEFKASNGKLLLGYGGSQSLQTPSYFSPAVNQLLRELGVVTDRFKRYYDSSWYEKRNLGDAVFFDKETFGTDKLVKTAEKASDWVSAAPLGEKAKSDLIALIDAPKDYMPGMSRDQKFAVMAQTSYARFLSDYVKADPALGAYFQRSTHEYFGCGIDAVTAADAWGNGNPGFDGMDLGDMPSRTMSPSGRLALTDPDDYIFHFPDGNASIARLLVRALIPATMKGHTMEDIVLARCDYSKLDRDADPVRLRLNATVARVQHMGDPLTAEACQVIYAKEGALHRVSAGHVIMACFHHVIPYIAPEFSAEQADALRDQQKIPLLYTNVQVRNWKAFSAAGVNGFEAPGHYWDKAVMDFPVSMGGYTFANEPEDPTVLHVGKVPTNPGGGSLRDQALAGRIWIYNEPFENMERGVRDLLARALGPSGFDPAHDIEGITVNRWSHGYAYEYMRPWDAYWPDGPLPITTSRRGLGRIAIANSDAGAYAYAHSAIDQATRAVRELLGAPHHAAAFATFPGPPLDKIGLA